MYQRSSHKELENTACQNLCNKSSGRRETYSSNVYFRKERSQINNSVLWKQEKKKEEKTKVKENRKKEVVKIKVEIKTVLSL